MSRVEQYYYMKEVIEDSGTCNRSYQCCNCPIREEVKGGCEQESAYEEATKWIESLSEEELFEILL